MLVRRLPVESSGSLTGLRLRAGNLQPLTEQDILALQAELPGTAINCRYTNFLCMTEGCGLLRLSSELGRRTAPNLGAPAMWCIGNHRRCHRRPRRSPAAQRRQTRSQCGPSRSRRMRQLKILRLSQLFLKARTCCALITDLMLQVSWGRFVRPSWPPSQTPDR